MMSRIYLNSQSPYYNTKHIFFDLNENHLAYDCNGKLKRLEKKVEILVTIYPFVYSVVVYKERNATAFDSTFGKNAVYCIARIIFL